MAPEVDIAALQSQIQALRGRPGRRYPVELINTARAYISQRRKAGDRLQRIARQLGVAQSTVLRWEGRDPNARRPKPRLRRVAIAPQESVGRGTATVIGPGGLRVEGLDVGQVAALFREMAGS